MAFRTQYDPSPRIIANPGNRFKTLYSPVYSKSGVLNLQESGQHDLYAEIQSHADSVDIHVLLERFAKGDVGALSRIQGAYGDFTQMPHTFAEALNTFIAAEQYFLGLPVEVRDRFGQDFHQFLAAMDTPDFLERSGMAPPPDQAQVSDVVPNPASPAQVQVSATPASPAAPPPAAPAGE